jgi:hypothetical protein
MSSMSRRRSLCGFGVLALLGLAGTATASTDFEGKLKPTDFVALFSGLNGELEQQLVAAGVPRGFVYEGVADLLFIDGRTPPDASVRPAIDAVLGRGGTVVVWGVSAKTLPQLNTLLPAQLELTGRQSSSLLLVAPSPLTAGLTPSDLNFTESSPSTILEAGLSGSLVKQGTVLLEAKGSGAAIFEVRQGSGRLLVLNLPAWSPVRKVQRLDRRLLENLGVNLNPPSGG